MTPFEIAIYAALIVIIGVLLVMLRNRQPNASADWLNYAGSWRRSRINPGQSRH